MTESAATLGATLARRKPQRLAAAADASASAGAGGGVRLLLRAEGVVLAAAASLAYAQYGAGWGLFAALFLVPDFALLAYLGGARAGALAYNAAHSTLGPWALLALGVLGELPLATAVALIWAAHIGLDRALGFGLKYARGFAHTHLGPAGPVDPW